jgi:hypothetical protein
VIEAPLFNTFGELVATMTNLAAAVAKLAEDKA